MESISSLFGDNKYERAVNLTMLSLPTACLAAHCWLSHRPLLLTSLATPTTIGAALLADWVNSGEIPIDDEDRVSTVQQLAIGSSLALFIWSTCKALGAAEWAGRSAWGANLLANASYLGVLGYSTYFNKEADS